MERLSVPMRYRVRYSGVTRLNAYVFRHFRLSAVKVTCHIGTVTRHQRLTSVTPASHVTFDESFDAERRS